MGNNAAKIPGSLAKMLQACPGPLNCHALPHTAGQVPRHRKKGGTTWHNGQAIEEVDQSWGLYPAQLDPSLWQWHTCFFGPAKPRNFGIPWGPGLQAEEALRDIPKGRSQLGEFRIIGNQSSLRPF